MRIFKPDALALDAVVHPLSTGGYQYRWTITVAYTCYQHRICFLPEHQVIDFLRKQHVPCVLDHVPFVVRCVMLQKTRTMLSTEKTEAWQYPDSSLSLIRFHAEFVSHATHAPEINALLFVLDYADMHKQHHIGHLYRALSNRMGPDRSQHLANQYDLLPRGFFPTTTQPVVKMQAAPNSLLARTATKKIIVDHTISQAQVDEWAWQDLHFTNCCFDEITFDQHTLWHLIFERCTFRGTQFTHCQCIDVHWQHCEFAFVRWQKVNAAQTYFVHTTMRQCTFHDTTLFSSKADHCRFLGVDLYHAAWHGLRLSHCVFKHVTYQRWGLADAMLRQCQFTHVRGQQWLLSGGGARICRTTFIDCHFPYANVTDSRWSQCVLEQCSLPSLQAQQSRWWQCTWQTNNLRESQWSGAVLLASHLADNFMVATNLQGIRQKNTQWQNNILEAAQGLAA